MTTPAGLVPPSRTLDKYWETRRQRLFARVRAAVAAIPGEPEGHDKPCYYCGEPTNANAGDPGLWPIPLCHRDDPGRVKWHHVRCVTDRLIENQPAAIPGEGREAWLPMETAPKDGTAIWLLYEGHPYMGYCEPKNPPFYPDDVWLLKASFQRRDRTVDNRPDDIFGCYAFDRTPTAWRPLPPPPKDGSAT